jgi:hypothetical protein
MEEKEDIYYVEIKNNERFKGVYVNEKVRLENEIVDEDVSSIKTEVDNIINDISNLNIDNELKRYLLKSELRIFNLRRMVRDVDLTYQFACRNIRDDFDGLKRNFKQLKHDLLGAEDNKIDEAIDED